MSALDPVAVANAYAHEFTPEFLAYLPANVHVFHAFEREALRIAARGFQRYSARTIIEVLRHHSALAEVGGRFKLDDWNTPYLARLFALMHPPLANLFEFRVVKAVRKQRAANDDHHQAQAGGAAC